jgi:hypothetical protein
VPNASEAEAWRVRCQLFSPLRRWLYFPHLRAPSCHRQSHIVVARIEFRIIPKMFHVKHFGPIEAQNLTSSQTTPPFRDCKLARFFGAIGLWVAGLPRKTGSLSKRKSEVRLPRNAKDQAKEAAQRLSARMASTIFIVSTLTPVTGLKRPSTTGGLRIV